MKLIAHFNDFLRDTVNLNQTRIDRLSGHVDAVTAFLKNSGYKPNIARFSPQGSWAHKTIIKPLANKEFDADLVMFLNPINGWSASDYVDDLYSTFRASGTYADKVGRNTRCVTLDYAGDFHLDVVPCIIRESLFLDDDYEVCNRIDGKFEVTDSEGYTEWITKRNGWTGQNMLRKATRLLKYLRDTKGTFSVKSILLTTMLGNRVGLLDSIRVFGDDPFCDVPTALRTLVQRLDDYLQDNPKMPVVGNPVLDGEDFNRHWDQAKYENFRAKVHDYRSKIDEAYAEADRDESIRKWRKVFGNDFAKGEVVEKAASAKAAVLKEAGGDIVAAVRSSGTAILSRLPLSLPHVQAPPWGEGPRDLAVRIQAAEYTSEEGTCIQTLSSGAVVGKHCSIRFEAKQRSGLPFPEKDYAVHWRVVNTDSEAAAADQLRGDFYRSSSHGIRWESTLYHGAHWVEAFIVSRRTGLRCGQSDRFFVVVD